mmetsp:Transcript_14637/g.31887  ORF Transcript_14637/g.31887 Transcript_14637/m.31887 type:complete len:332 (-) Transcript_14637:2-997(-)
MATMATTKLSSRMDHPSTFMLALMDLISKTRGSNTADTCRRRRSRAIRIRRMSLKTMALPILTSFIRSISQMATTNRSKPFHQTLAKSLFSTIIFRKISTQKRIPKIHSKTSKAFSAVLQSSSGIPSRNSLVLTPWICLSAANTTAFMVMRTAKRISNLQPVTILYSRGRVFPSLLVGFPSASSSRSASSTFTSIESAVRISSCSSTPPPPSRAFSSGSASAAGSSSRSWGGGPSGFAISTVLTSMPSLTTSGTPASRARSSLSLHFSINRSWQLSIIRITERRSCSRYSRSHLADSRSADGGAASAAPSSHPGGLRGDAIFATSRAPCPS